VRGMGVREKQGLREGEWGKVDIVGGGRLI